MDNGWNAKHSGWRRSEMWCSMVLVHEDYAYSLPSGLEHDTCGRLSVFGIVKDWRNEGGGPAVATTLRGCVWWCYFSTGTGVSGWKPMVCPSPVIPGNGGISISLPCWRHCMKLLSSSLRVKTQDLVFDWIRQRWHLCVLIFLKTLLLENLLAARVLSR